MNKPDNEMEKDLLQNYERLSLSEIKQEISKVAMQLDSPEKMHNAGALVAMYMKKLQDEYGPMVPGIYPEILLPVDKDVLKKIGSYYVESVYKLTGSVKRYQLDGGLAYTKFQPIEENIWNKIKNGEVPELVVYDMGIMNNGTSDIDVSTEYKQLIMNKYKEYSSGRSSLQEICKTNVEKTTGCFSVLLISLCLVFFILYIVL